MELRTQIEMGLKEAMKKGDEDRKRTYRLLLSSIKLAEVDKGAALDDPAVLSLIQKEIKIRRESLEGAQQAHREDLTRQPQAEIAILEDFLPKQMADEELAALIKSIIIETGASGPAGTGVVMKTLMPKIQGRAPGDKVSKMVRDILANS